jgi:hypothetical protein
MMIVPVLIKTNRFTVQLNKIGMSSDDGVLYLGLVVPDM